MPNAAVLVLVVALAFAAAPEARAQSEAAIGLGLAISSHDPTADLGIGTTKAGPLFRLKLGTGFGPSIGFDWHAVGANVLVGNRRIHLGTVRLKPVMGGVAYTWARGRYALSPALVVGYAFAGVKVSDEALPALVDALDADYLVFSTTGSVAWRTGLTLWYDAAPRVGLMASIAYLGTRPTVAIATDRGTFRHRLDTASTVVTFGLVYGVF